MRKKTGGDVSCLVGQKKSARRLDGQGTEGAGRRRRLAQLAGWLGEEGKEEGASSTHSNNKIGRQGRK